MLLSSPAADQSRLPMIQEDSDVLPPLPSPPPRASHRPFSKRWRDSPPSHNFEKSPPLYSVWDVTGPRGEKLLDVRNNQFLVHRGGWKRILIGLVFVTVVAIALGVGLGIGLPARNRNNTSNQTTSPTSNHTLLPFPLGSYSVTTYLDIVTADCTANPSTWSCFPGTTFATSNATSLVTFDWIINGTTDKLSISSTPNPFAITFTNASLVLLDAGLPTERYSFSISLDKYVIPSQPILPNNEIAGCFYNGTTFQASLYTKKPALDSAGTEPRDSSGQSHDWAAWPFAAEVNQTISGGSEVPNCYAGNNGVQGTRITSGLAPQATNNECSCTWRNFEL